MPDPGARPPALQASVERTHLVVRIRGPLAPVDVPAGCERVRALLAASDGLVVCDLAALSAPDLSTVDALARVTLDARRCGRAIRVRDAPPELEQLLEVVGLVGVVPCGEAAC